MPAYTTGEMIDLALQAGASARGWMVQGGNPVAIVVRPELIEVWSGREGEPRWSIPRSTIQEVGTFSGTFGARSVDVAGVRADGGGLLVIPAYQPVRNMGGSDARGLDQAVRALAGQ